MTLADVQADFYALCFGQEEAPPGRRALYRRLVTNTLSDALHNALPVFFAHLGKESGAGLIRRFMAEHRIVSRYYRDIPREFLTFLQKTHMGDPPGRPYTIELADYEWRHYDLLFRPNPREIPSHNPHVLLADARVILNPVHHLYQYDYPVHTLRKDTRAVSPERTALFLYRDPETYARPVFPLSPDADRALTALIENPDRRIAEIETLIPLLPELLRRRIVLAMV